MKLDSTKSFEKKSIVTETSLSNESGYISTKILRDLPSLVTMMSELMRQINISYKTIER